MPVQVTTPDDRSRFVQVQNRNRRKVYLNKHPEYFSSSLELADPLLYDRLIRKFRTPAECVAEAQLKGFSGVLEADILRSEAKLKELDKSHSRMTLTRKRASYSDVVADDEDDKPLNKEEACYRWRQIMELRFLSGGDRDFDYSQVDDREEYDDVTEERRRKEDQYFAEEEPAWILEDNSEPSDTGRRTVTGETGIQDF